MAYQTTTLALRYAPQIVYANLDSSSTPLTLAVVDDIHLDAFNDVGLCLRSAGFDPDDLDTGSRAERWAKTQEALLTSGYATLSKQGVNEQDRIQAMQLISRAVTAIGGWDPLAQQYVEGLVFTKTRQALAGEGANAQLPPAEPTDIGRRSDDARDASAFNVGDGGGIPHADEEIQPAIIPSDQDIGGPGIGVVG